jgi:hypothetical protein
MNNFFEQNHKLIYQEWISPSELNNSAILDLGSQTGWLGEYCMLHGSKEYVGVEIDEYHINDSRNHYPNLKFYHMDLEDYVCESVKENRFFDIVVISRTIHGIQNQISLLQNLSKITNKVVIETGVPVNTPAYRLLEILKDFDLDDKQKNEIEEIKHSIEYKQPFIEYVMDDRWPHPVPSTGLLEGIFLRLGFTLDLSTYELVKEKYPEEYGYGSRFEEDQLMKKSILKFIKVNNTVKPITWKEWDIIKDL